MKRYLLALAFTGATICSFGQDVNKLIKQDEVERIIKTLSADDMQGRATFTPGIEKAAQFIEGEFKSIGLKSLPGNTGYRQQTALVKTTPISAAVSINNTPVTANNIAVIASNSFTWSNITDAEIVTVTADMDFAKQYRTYLTSGKKQLVLVDTAFSIFFKRLQNSAKRGNTFFKDAAANPPVVFVLGKFNGISTYKVSFEVKTESLPLFNIAGMLPGKTKPDEFVVFSGHYDHLGIIKPMQGDSIANGADDDASGTTAVITLANYFKKVNNNARTLIFVTFAAEEIGEYGSQYFGKMIDPDKVMAMFNIEMIGKASKFGENSAFITGYERSDFGAILQKNLAGTQFKFYPDPYPEQNLFYRSDNATLARLGVPAHTISTDQIDVDKYYHTVKDEFSTLDVANITSTIKAIALSSRTIVSGEATPTRVPKSER